MSQIQSVENDESFNQILNNAGSKLVVVDFYASWCHPCHMIKPKFKEFASKYSSAKFVEVNVDACQEIAEQLGITAMPTFLFYKNNQKVDTLRGADAHSLEEKIIKWNTSDTDAEGSGVKGQMDLAAFIQSSGCELLNTEQPVENILKNDDKFVESDCDEQLIISVSFSQVVKLHSLKIHGPPDSGPKEIKIFINQPKTLDFDSAENMECVQEVDLQPDDIKVGALIPLRFVKFQNVSNITVFIKANQAETETSRVDYIAFIGNPAATTNMNDFKRTKSPVKKKKKKIAKKVIGKKGESH